MADLRKRGIPSFKIHSGVVTVFMSIMNIMTFLDIIRKHFYGNKYKLLPS